MKSSLGESCCCVVVGGGSRAHYSGFKVGEFNNWDQLTKRYAAIVVAQVMKLERLVKYCGSSNALIAMKRSKMGNVTTQTM